MHVMNEPPPAILPERPLTERAATLSRRTVLRTATVAASAVAGTAADAASAPVPEFGAPLAELHFPPGVLTREQKAAMIKGVTDVLIKATRLPPEHANRLWVQIFETAEDGWGIGGKVLVPRTR